MLKIKIKIKPYKLSLKERAIHLILHILALGFALYCFEGLMESIITIPILALVVFDVITIYRILEMLKRK